jgi:hypothetical protein
MYFMQADAVCGVFLEEVTRMPESKLFLLARSTDEKSI